LEWVENTDQNNFMKQGNTDYRNTYYFQNGNQISPADHPSISHDPQISTVIKENPYRTNVEIEKDEVVLKPDLSALHRAGGKKHAQGGTPVFLDENSFVFSDDKSLAFDKKDHDLFELKQGGKVKQNTPAKVLERNVDIKHYNQMMAILNDPHKDKLAKDTAAAMLEKYIQTVGNVAFLQEQKKQFPQGVPEFAQGSAPVYDTDLKNEIMEQKQYMKYGGATFNPYKMAQGGPYPDWLKGWTNPKSPMGSRTSTGQDSKYKYDDSHLHDDYAYWKGKAGRDFKDASDYQGFIYDYNLQHNPYAVSDMWSKYGQTNGGGDNPLINSHNAYGRKMGADGSLLPDTNFLGSEAVRNNFLDKPGSPYLGARTMFLAGQRDQPEPVAPHADPRTIVNAPPNPQPGEVTPTAQNGIPVNWQFTPWQKMSQLYQGMKWAGVDREMPYRSQYRATYMDPALVNPEQAVGDMKGAAYHMMEGQDLNSPILANAQKAAAYGDLLDKVPGIRSQYDNQNVGILNSTRQYNNQIKNQESMTNMQNDQQYYRDAATGRTNFKNMRGFMGDQLMNNVMQDVQDNQSLAYNMMTLGPKPAYGYDWKSGNFYRNDKNILDVQNNTSQGIYDAMSKEAADLYQQGLPPEVISSLIKSRAFSNMAPYLNSYPSYGQVMGSQNNPYSTGNRGNRFKKGGKTSRNPYK
jgi:hypothetical protein